MWTLSYLIIDNVRGISVMKIIINFNVPTEIDRLHKVWRSRTLVCALVTIIPVLFTLESFKLYDYMRGLLVPVLTICVGLTVACFAWFCLSVHTYVTIKKLKDIEYVKAIWKHGMPMRVNESLKVVSLWVDKGIIHVRATDDDLIFTSEYGAFVIIPLSQVQVIKSTPDTVKRVIVEQAGITYFTDTPDTQCPSLSVQRYDRVMRNSSPVILECKEG